LALGCNIFNLGFFPCFVAYPLLYKQIVRDRINQRRIVLGATLSAILGLQLGALGVVFQTFFPAFLVSLSQPSCS
jgi:cobalt/nickel transport system permease protein